MQKAIIHVTYTEKEMNFLINAPSKSDTPNAVRDWCPDLAWGQMNMLGTIEGFESFVSDVTTGSPGRFKDWYNELAPEDVKLPLDWKKLDNEPF